jgi:hypothetical protein
VRTLAEDARGRIAVDASGRTIINLFESRDLSTFIHESGHLYLEELRADAALDAVPREGRSGPAGGRRRSHCLFPGPC